MIAIAGAKGGCGKTTTALGLAQAFSRRGRPSVAVDADRQLPNLHVAAGVDREPTLRDAVDAPDPLAVAQAPADGRVRVLPAPPETDDVAAELARIADVDATVVVDCPAGAGPDVVDPLSAADRAVIVTTPTDGSVEAAATTADVARRLEVPVAGVVVTRANAVPPAVRRRIDAPVLGVVPDAESPLAADAARTAFDGVASALDGKSYGSGSRMVQNRMVDRLKTGIDVLDRKLDGGVPPGSIVAYTATAASQSELLLYELTAARGTLYLSTERSERAVRHALESSTARVGNPTVRRIEGEAPLDEARRLVDALPDGANLVVDTTDTLERADREAYVAFLNDLKAELIDTGSIAVLHCLKDDPPANRSRTHHAADAVFDLRTAVDGTELENHLAIPKFRDGGAPTETIKLELADEVAIDTSRDIA